MPENVNTKASKEFKTFKNKVMGLYKVEKAPKTEDTSTCGKELNVNLIENQTRIKRYEVTGNLNRDVSDSIFKTINQVIKMRTEVIYRFSCKVYRRKNEVIHYHKTLSNNKIYTSLREIEEFLKDVN